MYKEFSRKFESQRISYARIGYSSKTRSKAISYDVSYTLGFLSIVALVFSLAGQTGAMVAWGMIILWSLRGPRQAVESLVLSFLLVMSNPGVFAQFSQAASLRWIVLFSASARIGWSYFRGGFQVPHWFKYYFLLVAYLLGTSLVISPAPMLSLLKLGAYFLGSLTVFMGIWLSRNEDWSSILRNFGAVVLLLSLPLLNSSLGYLRNGRGFQGILNHPQVYGAFMAVAIALFIAWHFFDRRQSARLYHLAIFSGMLATAYLSQARTGLFALVIGLIIMQIYLPRSSRFTSLLYSPIPYFAVAAFILVIWWSQPADFVAQFVYKSRYSQVTTYGSLEVDVLFASRESIISRSWQNFLNHPVLGIGFSVPSWGVMGAPAGGGFANLPVTYSIEKSFLPTALLEETGLVGTALFLFMVFSQFRSLSIRREDAAPIFLIFFTAFFVNFGEMVYFSLGGLGLFIHVVMALALVKAMPEAG